MEDDLRDLRQDEVVSLKADPRNFVQAMLVLCAQCVASYRHHDHDVHIMYHILCYMMHICAIGASDMVGQCKIEVQESDCFL